jgi:glycerol-1-phosphate dehydrogenase [NAD(P)+]
MKLTYDPGDGIQFWEAVAKLPGYPAGVERPIGEMLFASNAIYRLPVLLGSMGEGSEQAVLVVMDRTPMRRGPDSLKPLVESVLRGAGWRVETAVLDPDSTGQVHTNLARIGQVKDRLKPDLSVLALGSGTVTDIAKHACYQYEKQTGRAIPFAVYPTANSVSAYTSNMAPVFLEGVKRTLPSRYPDAVVCDLETLRDAPLEMTVAGVGDLLAAFVSLADWYVAYRLGIDPSYTVLPQTLVGPLDEICLAQAEAIRTGQLEGASILAKLIALAGLAMSLSHATTPLSGFEHVMSHVLDLVAEGTARPLAQHGTQVALATVIASAAYERFLTDFDPQAVELESCFPDSRVMQAHIQTVFAAVDPSGKAGAECWADYRLKLQDWHAHREDFAAFLHTWPEVRSQIRALTRPPERLLEVLAAVHSPLTFAELDPPAGEAQVRYAFLNAPLMRKRLTIGDLFIFLNFDRERLWQLAWARLQAGIPPRAA